MLSVCERRRPWAIALWNCDNDATESTTFIRIGKPEDEIVKFAVENNIDLIAMGTHGRTGLAHMLVGSVAERVVRTSKCPVLTIRAEG